MFLQSYKYSHKTHPILSFIHMTADLLHNKREGTFTVLVIAFLFRPIFLDETSSSLGLLSPLE